MINDDTARNRLSIRNHLLSALSPDEFRFLHPHIKRTALDKGYLFADFCDSIKHCFFPNSGMVSLISVTYEGDTCEVGYIGFEGMVGLPAIFGKNEMPYQAVVQARTEGFRVPIDVVAQLFNQNGQFHDISLRFIYVLLRQFAQTSSCNHYHDLPSRLCRWLAVLSERSESRHLSLTQEFLAQMLGVQRTSIGPIAHNLQNEGVIKYKRGALEVIDLDRLKQSACDCYVIIKDELERFVDKP